MIEICEESILVTRVLLIDSLLHEIRNAKMQMKIASRMIIFLFMVRLIVREKYNQLQHQILEYDKINFRRISCITLVNSLFC